MVADQSDHEIEVEVPVNIALIKYWGKKDEELIIPLNNSVSLNIDGVFARTRLLCSRNLSADSVAINGVQVDLDLQKNRRFRKCFDAARVLIEKKPSSDGVSSGSGADYRFQVSSTTNFPVGAGLASSAAGFAAIAFAVGKLFDLSMTEVSALARMGSGSACRSVFGGLVEWQAGCDPSGVDSVAMQILPGKSWPELCCVVLVLDSSEKELGSSEGMLRTARTSRLLEHRALVVVPGRIERLKKAFKEHDFPEFARVVMEDSNQLHALCMDTFPPLKYLSDSSWHVIRTVDKFNTNKIRAAYTFDAGPNACIFLEREDVPTFLDLISNEFIISPEAIEQVHGVGDQHFRITPTTTPMTQFVVRNLIISRVGGQPRVVEWFS